MKLLKRTKIELCKTKKSKAYYGLFYCEHCNSIVEKQLSNGEKAQSCGCIRSKTISQKLKTHGYSKKPLYRVWRHMKNRCYLTTDKRYKHYGARGIKICEEWMDFNNFKNWALSNGYNENLSIDRINNNGNYEPNNCRWVDIATNNRNRRSIKLNFRKADEIKNLYYNSGYSQTELSFMYKIYKSQISCIVNNKAWVR